MFVTQQGSWCSRWNSVSGTHAFFILSIHPDIHPFNQQQLNAYYMPSLPSTNFLSREICCYSVAKLCPTLCDPTDYSTPGLSVPHYLLEFAKFMSIELVKLSSHLGQEKDIKQIIKQKQSVARKSSPGSTDQNTIDSYWKHWERLSKVCTNADIEDGLVNIVGEGKGEMDWESSIDICALPCVKQLVGSCCVTQEARPGALWWPRGVG